MPSILFKSNERKWYFHIPLILFMKRVKAGKGRRIEFVILLGYCLVPDERDLYVCSPTCSSKALLVVLIPHIPCTTEEFSWITNFHVVTCILCVLKKFSLNINGHFSYWYWICICITFLIQKAVPIFGVVYNIQ